MNQRDETLRRIRELLAYGDHFRRYQELPDFVVETVGLSNADYESNQLAWDQARYDWIISMLPDGIGTAVEIGSSLGYFCLRLAKERGIAMTGLEPVEDYAEVCNLFAEVAGLSDRLEFHGRGVVLDTISELPDADLLISLNVLHHAGNIYDADRVALLGGWRAYAVEYLTRLAGKYPHLVIQTGNTAKGEAHFPGDKMVQFMDDMLRSAGYETRGIGVITDFERIAYTTYPPERLDEVPVIWCRRNPETCEVEYHRGDEIVARLPYGTLQRPMFYCTRRA